MIKQQGFIYLPCKKTYKDTPKNEVNNCNFDEFCSLKEEEEHLKCLDVVTPS